jgi:hypothetical protein
LTSRSARWLSALGGAIGIALAAPAAAHERWVPHAYRPYDQGYFRSLAGETLELSLLAALGVACAVAVWYLLATPLSERLSLRSTEARAREATLPAPMRAARGLLRFALDGDVSWPAWQRGLWAAAVVFSRIPGAVLALGVVQGWLVMPSFPLHGPLAPVVRIAEAVLAAWCLWGRYPRQLGVALFAVFGWLILDYGIASIDAIPVLASAFFYYYATPGQAVNTRQLAGIRVSLGLGFMLLGLVNKIWHAELFIGVGDQFPELLDGPRQLIPTLTRESWSFSTALGEITFGLLLLLGLFDKLTTIALSAIFANFVLVFGWAEVVHFYPIAGFALLFFRAPPGTVLDGVLFRTHVDLWRRLQHPSGQTAYRAAVFLVSIATAITLMLGPIWLFVEVIPRIVG